MHRPSRVVGASDGLSRLTKAASVAVPLNGEDGTLLGQDAHSVTQSVLHASVVTHPRTDSQSICQADHAQVGVSSRDQLSSATAAESLQQPTNVLMAERKVASAQAAGVCAPGVATSESDGRAETPARGRKVGALSPACEGKLSLPDDAEEADLGDSAKPKAKPLSRTSNKVRMRVPDVRKRSTAVNQDWMFDSDEFSFWEGKTRPFTLDACADNEGTNSQCAEKFNCPNRSF
jgi:hypothetical protein